MNIGEEIVGSYLQYIKNCEFIQKNLYTPDIQGEIDVVGIDVNKKVIYVCEVAIHLITGLQYTKEKRPNNVNKLIEKFSKDIEYTNKYFSDYTKIFMFWSPIVKNQSSDSKYNQMNDILEIKKIIKKKYKVEVEAIINEKFLECLKELREYAKTETKDIKSPIIRLYQIEEYTKKHIEKLK
ncbi:MAG: hypothetical protein IPO37_02720 [Saprospiraceae bacterium]|nr:hypothetical protein [Saprospiraceae bacterium]MBP6740090.1 hypothetical protein [Leptospiraceae bacterium]